MIAFVMHVAAVIFTRSDGKIVIIPNKPAKISEEVSKEHIDERKEAHIPHV